VRGRRRNASYIEYSSAHEYPTPQDAAVARWHPCRGPLPRAGRSVLRRRCSGDLGADVIKVEDPDVGDESRTWPPHKDGESAGYLVNNRNKRGIAVNLKEPDGVALVRRLARRPTSSSRTSARNDGGVRPRLRGTRAGEPAARLLLRLGLRPPRARAPRAPATRRSCRRSAASCRSPASPAAHPSAAASRSSI